MSGARRFLENFLLTGEGKEIPDVFPNYQMDLGLYAPTNSTIRKNIDRMWEAFADISGLGKANVESLNIVYGDGSRLFSAGVARKDEIGFG